MMQDCSFHSFSKGCMIATLSLYRGEIRLPSRDEVVEERRQLTRLINGDAFFPLKSWPKETRLIFWEKKPMAYTETFKLVLFLIGNSCEPSLIRRWTMLARHWAESTTKAEKRARQVDFVLNNADQNSHLRFYFDIDYNKLLYLNGLPK